MPAIYYPNVEFRSLYIPHILKEIYLDEVFSRVDRPCNVVLDIGANIGLTAMYLKDFSNKVYAVEPSTEHFEALTENGYKNGWKNVIPYKAAISHESGMRAFYLDDWNRTTHSLIKHSGRAENVQCLTFADFMFHFEIDTVDFCKLDVECAEEAILRGEGFISVAPRIKSILIEFHDAQQVPGILQHMSNLGYSYENIKADAIIYMFKRK
jgi:FkbM family methyltransferase